MIKLFKRLFEKLRLEKIAIAAVLVAQALKRLVQSEITQLVIDLAPLPWVNFLSKVLGHLTKANEVLPQIVRGIVISKGMLDEETSKDHKIALLVLIDHLKNYSREELNEFIAFFALQIMNAQAGDGVISNEERAKIIEDSYQFLFKKNRQ